MISPPFPWFGGKSAIVDHVWKHFGQVPNYVEPFFGSGAMLLRRPEWTFTGKCNRETINDYDGHVANFWRACKHDPDGVAESADRIVHELDLHAVGDALFARASKTWPLEPSEWVEWIRRDEQNYDAVRAGQWCWFVANWIGGLPSIETGANRDVTNGDVHKIRPHIGSAGSGVSRQLPHIGRGGSECERRSSVIRDWMRSLRDRLRNVRCCCGDWSRVTGKAVTWNNAVPCAVFLDPPYSAEAGRNNELYSCESTDVAHAVRDWAIEEGRNRDMRIVLCGYDREHAMPDDWRVIEWKAFGGYANQGNNQGKENATRERVWLSPGCLSSNKQTQLF